MVMWPPCWKVTQSRFKLTDKNTAVGDERHVLLALWSRKDIQALQGGPWVCAVSALVLTGPPLNLQDPMQTGPVSGYKGLLCLAIFWGDQ